MTDEIKEVPAEVVNEEQAEDIKERKTTRHLKYVYSNKERLIRNRHN